MTKNEIVQNKKKKEDSIHKGHRARLVETAVKAGVDSLSDVQAVELFLTFIFPRGDVNPLAHALLKEYESFTHIVEANVEDLKRVKGINDKTARKITLFKELFYYFNTAKMGKKIPISHVGEIVDVVEDYLRFKTTEHVLLLAFSANNVITHRRLHRSDSSKEIGISLLDITSFINYSKPAAIAIAHCHPYGPANPSEDDLTAFNIVKNLCFNCGIGFIDSYIIGVNGVYSQKDDEFLRTYHDMAQLKELFQTLKG